jgi:peptide/nickel transport system substrate-binding protein
MTADDVIFSYTRVSSPATKSPSALYVRIIKGAKDVEDGKAQTMAGLKKIDDSTLQITLENPVDLPYFLFQPGTAILPKDEVEKKGDGFSSDPVGCGPFQFVKWVKGSEVTVKKFPDYFVPNRPFLDKIVFKIISESQARDNAFRARELDATVIEPVQYPVYKKDPAISKNIIEVAEMFTRAIGFNFDKEPFKKKEVRQAINHAIDRNLIIEKLLHGKAVPAVGWLPSTSAGFNPKAKAYDYDPAKAAELMKKAGYEKGFTVEAVSTGNASWGTVIFEAAMPMLKRINITLKIQQLEGAALVDRLQKGEFDMFSYSMGTGPEPYQALARWKGDASRVAGNTSTTRIRPSTGPGAGRQAERAKKVALLQQADGILLEDTCVMFFNYNKAVMAYHPGSRPQAGSRDMVYQDYVNIWLRSRSAGQGGNNEGNWAIGRVGNRKRFAVPNPLHAHSRAVHFQSRRRPAARPSVAGQHTLTHYGTTPMFAYFIRRVQFVPTAWRDVIVFVPSTCCRGTPPYGLGRERPGPRHQVRRGDEEALGVSRPRAY